MKIQLANALKPVFMVAVSAVLFGACSSDLEEPSVQESTPVEAPSEDGKSEAGGLEAVVWITECQITEVQDCEGLDRNEAKADVETLLSGYEGQSLLKFEFSDQASAYDEFKAYYADSPEILELVSQDSMPESFKVTFVPEASDAEIDQVVTEVSNVKGVRTVGSTKDNCENLGGPTQDPELVAATCAAEE